MKYAITKKVYYKHKKVLILLFLITYILFFPFKILSYVNFFLEKIVDFVIQLRNKIVYGIFKILFKKECRIEKEN